MAKAVKRKPKTTKTISKPYEPTERERASLDAFVNRQKKVVPSPEVKLDNTGDTPRLDLDHPDSRTGYSLLMEAIGTTNGAFTSSLLSQITNAGSKGSTPDPEGINFMLSVITGIQPRDQIETLLAAQMAAVHMQIMAFARRLAHVDNIKQQDSAERAFNKLTRTFTSQMEALNRYRGKGQQKMTVEHVHVHEGGQAIVGNVQGGGAKQKTGEQPHARKLTHAPGQTLPSQNKKRDTLPVSRNG